MSKLSTVSSIVKNITIIRKCWINRCQSAAKIYSHSTRQPYQIEWTHLYDTVNKSLVQLSLNANECCAINRTSFPHSFLFMLQCCWLKSLISQQVTIFLNTK